MKYIAIKENWRTLFKTNSKKEIDEYIDKNPKVFQVVYRQNKNKPYRVYYDAYDAQKIDAIKAIE